MLENPVDREYTVSTGTFPELSGRGFRGASMIPPIDSNVWQLSLEDAVTGPLPFVAFGPA
jgi:hypothetical protein